MNVKERIGSIIILTVLILSVIKQPVYAAVDTYSYIVGVDNGVTIGVSGNVGISGITPTWSWYNGSLINTPGSFNDSIGSISRNTGELYLVSNNTWLTQSYTNSIMNTLTSLYQNCSVPMATQLSYYLPIYKTDLEAIGTGVDSVATTNSQIKNNTDTIIGQLNTISNSINSKYIDPTISNSDKSIVTNTIDTMFALIPNNNDERYQLNIQSLIDQWATRDNFIMLQETNTEEYTDFY